MVGEQILFMTQKYIYAFGDENTEGNAEMKNLLGGKGANLAEMATLGIQVPPGFTISTEACVYYFQHKNTLLKNCGMKFFPA